ncbi:hypothetical protein [Nocardioides aurantiacus]|uniref:hypothetical protein n=1 Tax=Nocardioides aurantiacus TaxID=86796 RepID=UPI0011CE8800|nr:hypothetical protein [Nocardioides aurantiacus]
MLQLLFAYAFPYLSFRTGSVDLPGAEGTARYLLASEMSPSRSPDVAVQAMPLFGGAMMTVVGVLATGSRYGWDHWKTVATQGVPRRALIGGALAAATTLTAALVVVVMAQSLATSLAIAHIEGLPTTPPTATALLQRAAAGFVVLETWLLLGCASGVLAAVPAFRRDWPSSGPWSSRICSAG